MSTPVDRNRVREVFEAVCDLPHAERAAYLEKACAGDAALRTEVESLLGYDERTSDLLSDAHIGSGIDGGDSTVDSGWEPPERIGRYRIVRRIGAGGMGEVFEAEQESPQRMVALKVMHAAGSRDIARRFRLEGQIQARLNHPGIASVYEAGIHQEQRRTLPYFAMEFIDGRPIATFSREEKFSVRQRLAVMAEVCDAVHYAHQRGVIHRDLKPDNILVAGDGAAPHPKILDFGVAKLTDHDIRATTARTEIGQIIGTLAYMSPEQLNGRADEIDTRTDIYALGIILFQLLTGRPCHRTDGLSLPEAVRVLSESEPTHLASVDPTLRGDLDTIVAKAMSREKTRRYASASELAADIRRYLNDEPIAARPATTLYHLRKFASRNKPLVIAAGLGIAALVAGTITSTVLARAAVVERDRANDKAAEAARESEISASVANTLRQVFLQTTPDMTKGKDPTLRDAITRTAKRIEGEYDGPPEAEAIVRNIIGIVQRAYGEYDAAQAQFTRALEIRRRILQPDSTDIAEVLNNLALVFSQTGRAEESLKYQNEAIEILRNGPDKTRFIRSLFNLAQATFRAKKYDDAQRLTEESLALHTAHMPENLEVLGMNHGLLASIHRAKGDFAAAEASAKRSIELMRSSVGEGHPSLAVSLIELGNIHLASGHPADAEAPFREADKIARVVYATNPAYPTARIARENLAKTLRALNRGAEADEVEKVVAASPASDPERSSAAGGPSSDPKSK